MPDKASAPLEHRQRAKLSMDATALNRNGFLISRRVGRWITTQKWTSAVEYRSALGRSLQTLWLIVDPGSAAPLAGR